MTRPLTIAIANEHFLPGISRAFWDPARGLARRGHRVLFAASTTADGPQSGQWRDGVEFLTWPLLERLKSLRYLNAMRDAFRRAAATILAGHAVDCWLFNGPLCADAVLRAPGAAKIPSLYVFHSPWRAEWDLKARDAFASFRRRQFERWIGAPLRDLIERRGLTHATFTVTLSDYMRERLFAHHPRLEAAKWRLVRGWVDTERFHDRLSRRQARQALGLDPDRRVLLTIRRLERRMGVDVLMRAFAEVAGRFPDLDLVIGGTGTIEADLRAQAAALGLGERLSFRGFVPDDEMPLLYRAADLFVLPTQALEGFGLVSAEALACNTPVLGTPVGGIREVLKPFDERCLMAGTDQQAMAGALERFFKGELLDASTLARCRDYALANFHYERALDEFEALCRETAGRGADIADCGLRNAD